MCDKWFRPGSVTKVGQNGKRSAESVCVCVCSRLCHTSSGQCSKPSLSESVPSSSLYDREPHLDANPTTLCRWPADRRQTTISRKVTEMDAFFRPYSTLGSITFFSGYLFPIGKNWRNRPVLKFNNILTDQESLG